MKCTYILTMTVGMLIMITGCMTSKQQRSSNRDVTELETVEDLNSALSLSDHLRRLPGVSVIQNGAITMVTLKGFKSFEGHREPLFVVDGKMFGGGYEEVVGAFDVNDIKAIRVLRDINDRAQYGFRGSHGVIEITTKK